MSVPHKMNPITMLFVEFVRVAVLRRPTAITSAYRCARHPIEAKKAKPGTSSHCQGHAVDIAVRNGHEAFLVINMAMGMGATGFSYNAKLGFVHIDFRDTIEVTWNY